MECVKRFVPVLWEKEPLVAASTFHHGIFKPSQTSVVIAILCSRLGTKLKGPARALFFG